MIKIEQIHVNPNEMPGGFVYSFIGPPKTGKTSELVKWRKRALLLDADLGSDLIDCERITVVSLNPYYKNVETNRVITDVEKIAMERDGLWDEKQWVKAEPEERGYYHRRGTLKGKPMAVYSMAEIIVWVRSALKEGKFPYDTIVVDTIGRINEWIEEIVTTEMQIKSMGDAAYGSDWGYARKRNIDVIKRLGGLCRQYGIDLILIGHSKPSTQLGTTVQLAVDLPRGLAAALNGKSDVIGYVTINKETKRAQVSFEAYDERQVGSRFEALGGKTIPFSYESIKKTIGTYKREEKKDDSE